MALDYHDIETGSVPMRFLIGADGKLGNMRGHRAIGHLEHDILSSRAALFPIFQFEVTGISNEISIPNTAWMSFALATEIFRIAVETIHKVAGRIEDKVFVMKKVEGDGHAVDREKPRRLIALPIEVLVPGIKRQGEKAALLPFKRLLGSFVIPNGRCTTTFENIKHVFVQMPLRVQALSSGNFQNIGSGGSFRAFHVDEGAVATGSVPW